jgi:3-hydroxyisobutyrate dehydrogenase
VINAWVVGLTSVLAEAISLAEGLDVDPRLFLEAIEGGPLDVQYAHLKGELMFERAFDDPDFRLALARKDADLVLAAAEEAGIEIPVMHAVAERFVRAERGGHGDQDMAATYWASEPAAHR